MPEPIAAPGPPPALTGRGINAIETGGTILMILTEAARPLALSEIAERTAIPPGQLHPYLVSFRKTGLVEQDAASGRYQLGPLALVLGLARLRSHLPTRLTGDGLPELTRVLGLTTFMAVWDVSGSTVVQVREGAAQVFVNLRPGAVFPLVGSATGRAFAAFMRPELAAGRLSAELERMAQAHGLDAPLLLRSEQEEQRRARRRGYASATGSPIPGVNALSAPVFDSSGTMQLAVTVLGPERLVDIGENSREVETLLTFTRRVSGQLGFRGP